MTFIGALWPLSAPGGRTGPLRCAGIAPPCGEAEPSLLRRSRRPPRSHFDVPACGLLPAPAECFVSVWPGPCVRLLLAVGTLPRITAYHEHLGGTAKPATPLRRCGTCCGREGLAFDATCCCRPECTHPPRGVFARPRCPPPHPPPRSAVATPLPRVPVVGPARRCHRHLWPHPPR